MERRKKKVIAWAVVACSFILLVLYFPIVFLTDVDSGPVASATFATIVIVYFGSVFAAVKYSEDGWRIEGSTLEWIVAAMIAPFLAILLYFVSKNQGREETIDLGDHERLERL
jgi:uncharacterized membrane protein